MLPGRPPRDLNTASPITHHAIVVTAVLYEAALSDLRALSLRTGNYDRESGREPIGSAKLRGVGTEAINFKIIVGNPSQLQLQTFLQTNQHLFRLSRKAVRLACSRANSYVHFLDGSHPKQPSIQHRWALVGLGRCVGRWFVRLPSRYTQSITLDGSTFPQRHLISWSFPLTGGSIGIWSYPCIVSGSTQSSSTPPSPLRGRQVSNVHSYSAALTVNSGQLDTIFDIWLTSQPYGGSMAYEIEIAPQTDWTVLPRS